MQKKHAHYLSASIICFLASFFYLYEFALQVSPSIMTTELMQTYNVGAAGLGTLSAFYFYAYTPMQFPAGILYDHFGPRILLPIATLICAFGAALFAVNDSLIVASLGRFLMGFGSAFSFIGALLLISRWFPPRYFALLAGIVQLMSSVGAIFGEVPLAHGVEYFGWRHSMLFMASLGVFLALIMWLFIRDYPSGVAIKKNQKGKRQSLQGLGHILKNQQTWFVAIYAFSIWVPAVVFASLWGMPFLEELYHIATPTASIAIAMVWIGIGIGSPFMGWYSDKIGSRNIPLKYGALLGLVCILIILYLPDIPFGGMFVLLFGLGFALGGQALSFGVIKDITPSEYVGTAVGFNNMAVVAGGAIFQPLVGILLHLFWAGGTYQGAPVYSIAAYQASLWLLPICFLVAFILTSRYIRETHCQNVYEDVQ